MRWVTVPVDDEGHILSFRDAIHEDYVDAALDLHEDGLRNMLLTEDAFVSLGGIPVAGHPLQGEVYVEWLRYLNRCSGRPEDYMPEDPEILPSVTVEDAYRMKMLDCGIGLGVTIDPTDTDVPQFRYVKVIEKMDDSGYVVHLDRGYRMTAGGKVLLNVMVKDNPLTRLLHALWLGEKRRRMELQDG